MSNEFLPIVRKFYPDAPESVGIFDSTKIKTFLECPRKFLLEYILGIRPDFPNHHLIVGGVWHKVMEVFVETRDVDAAFEVYRELFFKDFPMEMADTLAPKDPANIYNALQLYANYTKDDPDKFKIISKETCEEIDIGAQAKIYAKIDLVVEEKDTGLIVGRDYKTTGMDTEPCYELDVQMLNYLMALHYMYGQDRVDRYEIDRIVFRKSKEVHGSKGGKGNAVERFELAPSTTLMRMHRMAMLRTIGEIFYEAELLADGGSDITSAFPPNFTSCDNYGGCRFCSLCAIGEDPVNYVENVPQAFRREFWDPREED